MKPKDTFNLIIGIICIILGSIACIITIALQDYNIYSILSGYILGYGIASILWNFRYDTI